MQSSTKVMILVFMLSLSANLLMIARGPRAARPQGHGDGSESGAADGRLHQNQKPPPRLSREGAGDGTEGCEARAATLRDALNKARDEAFRTGDPELVFDASTTPSPEYEKLAAAYVDAAFAKHGESAARVLECRDFGCQLTVNAKKQEDLISALMELQKDPKFRAHTFFHLKMKAIQVSKDSLTGEILHTAHMFFPPPVNATWESELAGMRSND
jgi:hypothetical protein